MTPVSQLTDEQATNAANFVVREWIKVDGLEALALWQTIEKVKTGDSVETWVEDPKSKDPEVAKLCRQMLQVFLDSPRGKGPNFRKWAQQGIDKATEAHGQMLDPGSLIIGGTLLIGLVLAARVKSVGPSGVEFFKGLPANLSKLVKLASSMATFS